MHKSESKHSEMGPVRQNPRGQRRFTEHKQHAGPHRAEKCRFCTWWPWPLTTLTLKLARLRHPTRLPCEFGANLFSGFRDISHTNKKPQTDIAKNRTLIWLQLTSSVICDVLWPCSVSGI